METPRAIERLLIVLFALLVVVCTAAAVATRDAMPLIFLVAAIGAFAGICAVWLCVGGAVFVPFVAILARLFGRRQKAGRP